MAINPKNELFCQYYAKDELCFGNATLSYAEAYGYFDKIAEHKNTDLVYNQCSVSGKKLLRIAKIKARVTELLNEWLKDDIVDAELAKVIRQDYDLSVKVSAIKEYNKLKSRIVEKHELSVGRKSTDKLQDEELNRLMDVFGDKEIDIKE